MRRLSAFFCGILLVVGLSGPVAAQAPATDDLMPKGWAEFEKKLVPIVEQFEKRLELEAATDTIHRVRKIECQFIFLRAFEAPKDPVLKKALDGAQGTWLARLKPLIPELQKFESQLGIKSDNVRPFGMRLYDVQMYSLSKHTANVLKKKK